MPILDSIARIFRRSDRPRHLPPGPDRHTGPMRGTHDARGMAQLAMSELKMAPRTLLPQAWSLRPQWASWNVETAFTDAWKGSTWCYVCTMLTAKALSSVPWSVHTRRGRRLVPVETSTPLQRLIERPNPYWTQRDLIMRIALELQIAGNSIVVKVRSDPSAPPGNIFTVRPQLVAPIPSNDIHCAGFSIIAADGRRYLLGARDAVHIQLPDPSNSYWGMSPTQAAMRAIETDREAADWQKASLENGMVPQGAFVVEASVTDSQYERIVAEIEEQYAGAMNARTPLVLSGTQFQQLSLSPVDLDFVNGRKMSREEICAVYGVPQPVAGIYDRATFNNISEARAIWWEDTLLPLAHMISDTLTRGLAREFGREFVIAPVTTHVPALVAALAPRIKMARELWQMGVPANSAFDFLGLDLEVDGGDLGYVPSSVIPSTPEGQLELEDMNPIGAAPDSPLAQIEAMIGDAPAEARRAIKADRRARNFRRWLETGDLAVA